MNISETEFKPVTLSPPHFVVASEKLFNTSIGNNFANEFKDGHLITLIDHHNVNILSPEEIKIKTQKYYNNLSSHWDIQYHSRVFIGLGQDSLYLYNLYNDHKLVFDAAVLINFDFDLVKDNKSKKTIKKHTKIYNFYSDNKKYSDTELALVNQYIPTKLSPAYNKRFALETNGVLVNGVYELLYVEQNSPSEFITIGN